MTAGILFAGVLLAVIGFCVIFRVWPARKAPPQLGKQETEREAYNRNARAAAAWTTDNTYQDYDGITRSL